MGTSHEIITPLLEEGFVVLAITSEIYLLARVLKNLTCVPTRPSP